MVTDAGADIFQSSGISPLTKWVDDHIFFRIPRACLPGYNSLRKRWQQEIREQGERRQTGSRLWYGGKELPEGPPEEFDKDCSMPLVDMPETSPRPANDHFFSYADADIEKISTHLGDPMGTLQIRPVQNRSPIPWFPMGPASTQGAPPRGEKGQILGGDQGVGGKVHP